MQINGWEAVRGNVLFCFKKEAHPPDFCCSVGFSCKRLFSFSCVMRNEIRTEREGEWAAREKKWDCCWLRDVLLLGGRTYVLINKEVGF